MNQPSIMVKLSVEGDSDFMGIKTYDRTHGSRGRFLISRDNLSRMLSKPGGMIHYDSDCGHYAKVWRIGNYLWFHITWLSHYDSGAVKGFEQMFSVPVRAIRRLLTSGGNAKLLCSPVHTSALIKTSPSATATIRNLTHNKRVRRAFSKAMRDCFNWSGDCVTLYRDGGYNFYFTTRSGIPKCGGLILHEIEKDGYRYIYYSVHT